MHEGPRFDFGDTDYFSGLAESPPPPPEKPPKTPEFFDDDDDEDVEEEPKTIRDYFEKKNEEKTEDDVEEEPSDEPEAESVEDEDQESETEDAEEDTENPEIDDNSKEMTAEEEQQAAVEIIEERQAETKDNNQEATPDKELEDAAAENFLETAKHEIAEGQNVDEALETAKAKTLEEIGVEPEEPAQESEPDQAAAEDETEQSPATEAMDQLPPVETEEPEEAPIPPTAPAASVPPSGPVPPIPPGGGVPGGPMPTSHDSLPTMPTPAPEKTESTIEDRRRVGHPLLVGGIIGYMIGRRRGRIKTEKELLPIQHKLEKEVKQLQDKIFWHEASVRSLAHERAVKNPEVAKQATDKLKAKQETKPETVGDRIGKTQIENEVPVQTAKSETQRTPEQLKNVDLMTVPELLVIAERIEIEQSTVRRLYESNRLSYEGLRRIVQAFLRGERYDQLVRDNLLTPEKYSYPETLTPNGLTAEQLAQNQAWQNAQSSQSPMSSTQNPVNSWQSGQSPQTPNKNTWQNDQHLSVNLSAVVAVGVLIAVLLVVFVILR